MLTTLRHFQLWDIAQIEPSLLYNLTLLTSLELVTSHKFNNTHMAALLGVLPKLQQLQHLDILCSLRYGSPATTMQLEQCSALTASTNLVSLFLQGVHLPAACGSHLFGHMLPQLKAIHMDRPGTAHTKQPSITRAQLGAGGCCCSRGKLPALGEAGSAWSCAAWCELE
jgi:hypothetical protein